MAMRLGMLGMWHSHAQGVVDRVAENPGEFELVGGWDPEPEIVRARSERWTKQLPGFRIFDAPEKVLAQTLQGVVVEGRVHENLKYARMALEAGFPVLLEKPAGVDLAGHRRLIDLARSKHLHVQMAYLFRSMSAVVELLARARRGDLGRIYHFRARLPKDIRDYDRFVEELKLYRGGIFFEMAGHVIDLMVAILGRPKAIKPFLGHHGEKPGAFVDNGVVIFEYEHAWGIIEVPILESAPHQRRIEIFGTRGACIIPHLGSGHLANRSIQPLEVYQAGKERWETLELPAATLQLYDLRELAACASGKKQPDFGFDHDLAVQEALLAASRM